MSVLKVIRGISKFILEQFTNTQSQQPVNSLNPVKSLDVQGHLLLYCYNKGLLHKVAWPTSLIHIQLSTRCHGETSMKFFVKASECTTPNYISFFLNFLTCSRTLWNVVNPQNVSSQVSVSSIEIGSSHLWSGELLSCLSVDERKGTGVILCVFQWLVSKN